jgi:photoactive yellow protein
LLQSAWNLTEEMSMQIVRYAPEDIENVLAQMNTAEVDKLPCGAIQLDSTGRILFYNQAEGEIVGRKPEEVIGKSFFDEVAPCTKTPQFFGEFEKLVANAGHKVQFQYTFDYKMKPTRVSVSMRKANFGDSYWVLVNRA